MSKMLRKALGTETPHDFVLCLLLLRNILVQGPSGGQPGGAAAARGLVPWPRVYSSSSHRVPAQARHRACTHAAALPGFCWDFAARERASHSWGCRCLCLHAQGLGLEHRRAAL